LEKVNFDDCLVAFDFSILQKFESLSECLFKYIDRNIQSIRSIPRFVKLAEASVSKILEKRDGKSKSIEHFIAFSTWIEDKEKSKKIRKKIKTNMISCFELKNFTRSEIQKVVRNTGFYKEKDIFDVLQEKYDELEETLSSQKRQLESQKQRAAKYQKELQQEHQRSDKLSKENTHLKHKLEEEPNMCLFKNGGQILRQGFGLDVDYQFFSKEKVICKFQDSELINKVEFTLLFPGSESYTIESSIDGRTWSQLVDFSNKNCKGRQVVYFKKTNMKYLCIKLSRQINLYRDPTNWMKVENGDVVAILDTTTIERKNQGQGYY